MQPFTVRNIDHPECMASIYQVLDLLRRGARPLNDIDELTAHAGSASYVLIGEASHGTHEFYEIRAEITKRLIREHGFLAVAAEADWPDAQRIDRYVRGRSADTSADSALSDFLRFPRWMWRNRVVEEFVWWLREYNRSRSPQAGFYGVDLYSMYASRDAVIQYLDRVDADAARRARDRYACFDHYGEDPQSYGLAAGFSMSESCETEAVQQLVDLQRRSWEYMHRDGHVAEDDFFSAEQNARLVRNAEEYYRSMFRGRVSTWNLRDRHMAETVHAMAGWLERRHGYSKIVLWEHNSHLGDARATEMSRRGEFNVGQLMRERYPGQTFTIGFTTWTGTVTAATDWGDDAETKKVRPGLPGSWETLFHEVGESGFVMTLHAELADAMKEERLERAIGVIYRPETERVSHYFHARLAEQFDAVIHVDTTRALEPLDRISEVSHAEAPETFPSGL
jgi:erythromycin esterase-like protein